MKMNYFLTGLIAVLLILLYVMHKWEYKNQVYVEQANLQLAKDFQSSIQRESDMVNGENGVEGDGNEN